MFGTVLISGSTVRGQFGLPVGRPSPHANRAIGHDQQTGVDFELKKGQQMAPDKGQDGTSARRGRAKDDNAVVVVWRV